MYKNTRLFISERLRYSQLTVRVVSVIKRPIHAAQACLENANLASSLDVLGSGSKQNPVVSGWIAHRYDPITKVSQFDQHWWNFDPIASSYFDTTRFDQDVDASGFEYVMDDEVGHFASTQRHRLEHSVGRDLAYAQDMWFTLEVDEEGKGVL